jgi:copper chaperone CopZ
VSSCRALTGLPAAVRTRPGSAGRRRAKELTLDPAVITVKGMASGHCVSTVRQEIGSVTGVEVELDTGAVHGDDFTLHICGAISGHRRAFAPARLIGRLCRCPGALAERSR